MKDWLDFLRGFVRPYIAYLFSAVFAGLAIYLAIKYANEDIAKTIIVGFIATVSAIIGFYYGQRQTPP